MEILMHRSLKSLRSGSTVAAFALVLLAPAVALAAAPAPKGHRPLPAASRTGESFFRGIVFGDGDVARALPELWAVPSDAAPRSELTRQVQNAVKDSIIADMRRQEPGYFDELASAINAHPAAADEMN